MAHLRSVSRLYSLLTVRKSRLIRYKHGSQTSLEGKFEGSSLCVLCVFLCISFMLLWFIYGPWAGLTASSKHYLEGISLYTRLYFLLCFTVLLKCLRRLYACGSIFKCCQCIITAPVNNHCTCWRTNPLLTKHWLIRGTLVSVYIDHVTYFNRTTTVTNLIRAYNTICIPCPETRLFHVPFKWYKHI
jgi:hypothetical protein